MYVGEKMIRTLTTFIGVTKNNNIGRNSFYEKYILTDEKIEEIAEELKSRN